ncbi:MAG: hypothetical protein RLZZ387_4221 [Chloroflexota bacterium]
MGKRAILFTCRACGASSPASGLRAGAWGDRCCPACGSADVERRRRSWESVYAAFFLFKVY